FCKVMDVCGRDYPTPLNRFEVVYSLIPPRNNKYIIRVKTYANSVTPVPSVAPPYDLSYSLEDSLGIYFEGHPDLRRILMDYGLE
ncbi:hypothetical protein BJ741DRAFT_511924, partial [Chytriomyces cf. hyalinus JEL632]